MGLKISKGLWFVSILGVLTSLLVVYAGLPEEVLVQENASSRTTLSREVFFYLALALVTILNSLIFVMSSVYPKSISFRAWFNMLVMFFNLFFVVTFFLINSVNSTEKFNFGNIGFMIYGTVALLLVWGLAWPVYVLYQKYSGQASINL